MILFICTNCIDTRLNNGVYIHRASLTSIIFVDQQNSAQLDHIGKHILCILFVCYVLGLDHVITAIYFDCECR